MTKLKLQEKPPISSDFCPKITTNLRHKGRFILSKVGLYIPANQGVRPFFNPAKEMNKVVHIVSGSSGSNTVWVQVPSPAPRKIGVFKAFGVLEMPIVFGHVTVFPTLF